MSTTLRERAAAALVEQCAVEERKRLEEEAREGARLAAQFALGAERLGRLLASYCVPAPYPCEMHPDAAQVDDGAICPIDGIIFEVQGRPEQRRGVEFRLMRLCPQCAAWQRSVWNLRLGDLALLGRCLEPNANCWLPCHECEAHRA